MRHGHKVLTLVLRAPAPQRARAAGGRRAGGVTPCLRNHLLGNRYQPRPRQGPESSRPCCAPGRGPLHPAVGGPARGAAAGGGGDQACEARRVGDAGAAPGLGRNVALYHRSPLYTRFTNIFGASPSETTVRPNPRRGSRASSRPRHRRARRRGRAASSARRGSGTGICTRAVL